MGSASAETRPAGSRRALLTPHLWLLLVAAACATRSQESDETAAVHEPEPVSVEGWASETIPLPPGFAPGLPTGTEVLRFSPGFRDPVAGDFWSYAFVMWIDEAAPDVTRLDEMLEEYYDGLISAVAAGSEEDVGSDPAQVEVTRVAANMFEAKMQLIDAFTTFEPVDLILRIEAIAESDRRTVLQIQASPQPTNHEIWRSLKAAIADIQEPR